MNQRIARNALLACAIAVLSGCGGVSMNLWPFDGDKEQNVSRTPAGATAYTCENSKHLYVRFLENGAAAWVILQDREFRLNKISAAAGTRYGNGNSTLDIQDGVATLTDGGTATHTGCKLKNTEN
ncbi:MAG: MliC family protein [Burkholderiales bacterium]|nr:MliC family protein [Burkholderiales bacterium]